MNKSILMLTVTMLFSSSLMAETDEAMELHQSKCSGCHADRFGGDPDAIYTRSNRKVTSLNRLKGQVGFCAQMIGAQWFDDEIDSVTNFLNKKYYHF